MSLRLSQYLFGLRMNFSFYLDRIFTGNEAGEEVTEEVLDGVYALGRVCMWMQEWDECRSCYERAKTGYECLLPNSAKFVDAALVVASQTLCGDERIAEYRHLWEMAKVSLPDEAITLDLANDLRRHLDEKGQHEEAKVLFLAALEGRRRVPGRGTQRHPQFAEQHGRRP